MKKIVSYIFLILVVTLSGCATAPLGPGMNVHVQPAPNKPNELYQQEADACRQQALAACGGQETVDRINQQAATNAIVGVGIGVLAGALIGQASGNQGAGAQIGAASGLLAGTSAGAGATAQGNVSLQAQYDEAFKACMSSKGNLVAGYAEPGVGTERHAGAGVDGVIIDAQNILSELGYYHGTIDGRMSKSTVKALKDFQRDQHIKITGKLDDATMVILRNQSSM